MEIFRRYTIEPRYLILTLVSLSSLGSYFIYDNPSVLQSRIQKSLEISDLEFSLFYSIYGLPNIFFPVFGGYLIDIAGVRTACVLFTVIVSLGQSLFASGLLFKSYFLSLAGRALFGAGGENLNVSSNYFIMKWFKAKDLGMALAINFSISRVGSVLNGNLIPLISEYSENATFGLWCGFVLCLFSILAAVSLAIIDKKTDRVVTKEKENQKLRFQDIKNFNSSFWMVCLNLMFSYASIFCFNNIASNYLQERFEFSVIESGSIASITYGIATFLAPVLGFYIDMYGHRAHFLCLASLIVTLVHVGFVNLLNSYKPAVVVILIIGLGIGYSIYVSCIWSVTSVLIDAKVAGVGNGICVASYNLGLALGSICAGSLEEYSNEDKNHFWVGMFLIFSGFFSFLSSLGIYLLDLNLGILKRPSSFEFEKKVF